MATIRLRSYGAAHRVDRLIVRLLHTRYGDRSRSEVIVAEQTVLEGSVLEVSGLVEGRLELALPPTADSSSGTSRYHIEAFADIPGVEDPRQHAEIEVARPLDETIESSGVSLALRCSPTRVRAGGRVSGVLTVRGGTRAQLVTGALCKLVAQPRVEPGGGSPTEPEELARCSLLGARLELAAGGSVELPFSLQIPRGALPSAEGRLYRVESAAEFEGLGRCEAAVELAVRPTGALIDARVWLRQFSFPSLLVLAAIVTFFLKEFRAFAAVDLFFLAYVWRLDRPLEPEHRRRGSAGRDGESRAEGGRAAAAAGEGSAPGAPSPALSASDDGEGSDAAAGGDDGIPAVDSVAPALRVVKLLPRLFGASALIATVLLAFGFLSLSSLYSYVGLPMLDYDYLLLLEDGAKGVLSTVSVVLESPTRVFLFAGLVALISGVWISEDRFWWIRDTINRPTFFLWVQVSAALASLAVVMAMIQVSRLVDYEHRSSVGRERVMSVADFEPTRHSAREFARDVHLDGALGQYLGLVDDPASLSLSRPDAPGRRAIPAVESSDENGYRVRATAEARDEARRLYAQLCSVVVLLVVVDLVVFAWRRRLRRRLAEVGEQLRPRRRLGVVRGLEVSAFVLTPMTAISALIALGLIPVAHGVLARSYIGDQPVIILLKRTPECMSAHTEAEDGKAQDKSLDVICSASKLEDLRSHEIAYAFALEDLLTSRLDEPDADELSRKYKEKVDQLIQESRETRCLGAVERLWVNRPQPSFSEAYPEAADYFWHRLRELVSAHSYLRFGNLLSLPRGERGDKLSFFTTIRRRTANSDGRWILGEVSRECVEDIVVIEDANERSLARPGSSSRQRLEEVSLVNAHVLRRAVVHLRDPRAELRGAMVSRAGVLGKLYYHDEPALVRMVVDDLVCITFGHSPGCADAIPPAGLRDPDGEERGAAATALYLIGRPYAAMQVARCLSSYKGRGRCLAGEQVDPKVLVRDVDTAITSAGFQIRDLTEALDEHAGRMEDVVSEELELARSALVGLTIDALKRRDDDGVEKWATLVGAACTSAVMSGFHSEELDRAMSEAIEALLEPSVSPPEGPLVVCVYSMAQSQTAFAKDFLKEVEDKLPKRAQQALHLARGDVSEPDEEVPQLLRSPGAEPTIDVEARRVAQNVKALDATRAGAIELLSLIGLNDPSLLWSVYRERKGAASASAALFLEDVDGDALVGEIERCLDDSSLDLEARRWCERAISLVSIPPSRAAGLAERLAGEVPEGGAEVRCAAEEALREHLSGSTGILGCPEGAPRSQPERWDAAIQGVVDVLLERARKDGDKDAEKNLRRMKDGPERSVSSGDEPGSE